jgi:hypothetical protein
MLRELQGNPLWKEILETAEMPPLPSFKPSDKPPENEESRWKYFSGYRDGMNAILSILRPE